jgi:Carboxypeptidase regulatory-like domain
MRLGLKASRLQALIVFSGITPCLVVANPLLSQPTHRANPSATVQEGQSAGALSGTVTTATGGVAAKAKVSAKNSVTGQTAEAEAGPSGNYSVADLAPGEYEVSVSAEGFATKVSKITIAPGVTQKLDVVLAPPANPQGPSLSDLGFSTAQTQGSAQQQALLDKRTHMLKIHQRMGLITTGPLLATVIAGSFAGGRSTSSTTRDVHAALGSSTAILYFTTAYFAIRAPKPPGAETRGPIRWHKRLAWIHGPGMVLTPVLGALAIQQKDKGERVHGIAKLHGPVGFITAGAYGAAILAVSVKF